MSRLRFSHGRLWRFDPLLDAWVWLEIRGAAGGTNLPPPTPAQEEGTKTQTDVMRQQLDVAKQQQAFSQAVTPLQLAQGGYQLTEQTDPNAPVQPGQYVLPIGGKNYVAQLQPGQKELQDLNTQVSLASGKRALSASKGELAVDPSVEQNISLQEQDLRNELMNRLGPGYETSDPGQRALNDFKRQSNTLRFQVQYGELSNANALSLSTQAGEQRQRSQLMGTLANSQQPYQLTAGLLGQAGQTGANLVGQEQGERFGAFNARMQQSQIGAGLLGAGISGGLGAAGNIYGANVIGSALALA